MNLGIDAAIIKQDLPIVNACKKLSSIKDQNMAPKALLECSAGACSFYDFLASKQILISRTTLEYRHIQEGNPTIQGRRPAPYQPGATPQDPGDPIETQGLQARPINVYGAGLRPLSI